MARARQYNSFSGRELLACRCSSYVRYWFNVLIAYLNLLFIKRSFTKIAAAFPIGSADLLRNTSVKWVFMSPVYVYSFKVTMGIADILWYLLILA